MFSNRIANLHPYTPGEQPSDREYIKLNANENPFPPSQSLQKVLNSVDITQLALYPDPESIELKEAITQMYTEYGISSDMIFVGNGSDEVLSFVFYAFFDGQPQFPVVMPEFTYSFYPVYANYYDISLKKIPLRSDFTLDTGAMISEPSCGIIFANPNAPTGIALPRADIKAMLKKIQGESDADTKMLIVDEAYIDFGGETSLPLLAEFKNLVVIRTFSKSMSFAGMRLGFAIANRDVIRTLTTVKNSFNHFPVDSICQKLAAAACRDSSYYMENCHIIAITRNWFSNELCKNGWIVLPSSANFVFAKKEGMNGSDIYKAVKNEGILIRHFNTAGISDFVRITIGTAESMKMLLTVLIRLN